MPTQLKKVGALTSHFNKENNSDYRHRHIETSKINIV